jgi:hypothetical protein
LREDKWAFGVGFCFRRLLQPAPAKWLETLITNALTGKNLALLPNRETFQLSRKQ